MKTRIAILGTFDESRPSRSKIGPALEHSAAAIGVELEYTWMPPDLADERVVESFNGIFVGPGDPVEDIAGILQTIRAARQNQLRCLGTCGGFQRIVTEYARHELGFDKLENEEVTPDAVDPFFSRLQCSLVGRDAEVELVPGSQVARIYASDRTTESFFCGYGVNGRYLEHLQRGRLKVSACDSAGEARVVELAQHPFFMGTLFVPQVRSMAGRAHPLITGFLRATLG